MPKPPPTSKPAPKPVPAPVPAPKSVPVKVPAPVPAPAPKSAPTKVSIKPKIPVAAPVKVPKVKKSPRRLSTSSSTASSSSVSSGAISTSSSISPAMLAGVAMSATAIGAAAWKRAKLREQILEAIEWLQAGLSPPLVSRAESMESFQPMMVAKAAAYDEPSTVAMKFGFTEDQVDLVQFREQLTNELCDFLEVKPRRVDVQHAMARDFADEDPALRAKPTDLSASTETMQVTFSAAKDASEPRSRDLVAKLSSALDAPPSERSPFNDLEEIVPLQTGWQRGPRSNPVEMKMFFEQRMLRKTPNFEKDLQKEIADFLKVKLRQVEVNVKDTGRDPCEAEIKLRAARNALKSTRTPEQLSQELQNADLSAGHTPLLSEAQDLHVHDPKLRMAEPVKVKMFFSPDALRKRRGVRQFEKDLRDDIADFLKIKLRHVDVDVKDTKRNPNEVEIMLRATRNALRSPKELAKALTTGDLRSSGSELLSEAHDARIVNPADEAIDYGQVQSFDEPVSASLSFSRHFADIDEKHFPNELQEDLSVALQAPVERFVAQLPVVHNDSSPLSAHVTFSAASNDSEPLARTLFERLHEPENLEIPAASVLHDLTGAEDLDGMTIIDQPVSTRLAFAFPYAAIDEGKFADEVKAELADVLHVPQERFDVILVPGTSSGQKVAANVTFNAAKNGREPTASSLLQRVKVKDFGEPNEVDTRHMSAVEGFKSVDAVVEVDRPIAAKVSLHQQYGDIRDPKAYAENLRQEASKKLGVSSDRFGISFAPDLGDEDLAVMNMVIMPAANSSEPSASELYEAFKVAYFDPNVPSKDLKDIRKFEHSDAVFDQNMMLRVGFNQDFNSIKPDTFADDFKRDLSNELQLDARRIEVQLPQEFNGKDQVFANVMFRAAQMGFEQPTRQYLDKLMKVNFRVNPSKTLSEIVSLATYDWELEDDNVDAKVFFRTSFKDIDVRSFPKQFAKELSAALGVPRYRFDLKLSEVHDGFSPVNGTLRVKPAPDGSKQPPAHDLFAVIKNRSYSKEDAGPALKQLSTVDEIKKERKKKSTGKKQWQRHDLGKNTKPPREFTYADARGGVLPLFKVDADARDRLKTFQHQRPSMRRGIERVITSQPPKE